MAKRTETRVVNGKKRPAHRPPSANVALQNAGIALEVLYTRVLHPDRQSKWITITVATRNGVSEHYVKKILRTMDPGRRRRIEINAAALSDLLR
jgi:hypothetical protein